MIVHPHLKELYQVIFQNESDQALIEYIMLFLSLILYLPSTFVFACKFFNHCVEQRNNPYYAKEPWLIQFIASVLENNSGNIVSSLMCGIAPTLIIHTTFLIPLMFFIWYLVNFSPFDMVYKFYVSRIGYPVRVCIFISSLSYPYKMN